MKKIFFLFAAALILFSCGNGTKPTAQSVLQRHYEAAGLDKIDLTNQSIATSMELTSMGMQMPISAIIQYPDRMAMEMSAMGQTMKVVVDGDQGWMSVPEQGVVEIPSDQIAQMWKQSDVFSNMKWDEEVYDATLLDPVEENGVKYDVVKLTVKEGQTADVGEMTLHFDHETGLLAYTTMTVKSMGMEIPTKSVMSEYTTVEGITYPALIEVEAMGAGASTIKITKFELNYPTTDQMFAKPE